MLKKIMVLFILVLAVTGCLSRFEKVEVKKASNEGINTLIVPEGFNFKMSKKVDVVLTNVKLAKTEAGIYDSNGTLLEKGVFNNSGKYQTSIAVKSSAEKIVVKSINIKNPISLTVEDKINYNIPDIDLVSKIKTNMVKRPGSISGDRYTTYFPGEGKYGTLAYEDKWPKMGDYDCNDLVVNYNYALVTEKSADGTTNIVELLAKFIPGAAGAGNNNGFGIQLDIDRAKIDHVTGYEDIGSQSIDEFGLEKGQNKPVIIVFNNAKQVFGDESQQKMYNTIKGETFIKVQPYNIRVVFKGNTKLNELKNGFTSVKTPLNPFIFRTRDRGLEVHLKGEMPTDLATSSIFNTEDDRSNSIKYSTTNGLPWALDIPDTFSYPIEYASIIDAYKNFDDWVLSKGQKFWDWYNVKNGEVTNFDMSKIYLREELGDLGIPQNLRVVSKTSESIKLTWDSVKGANSYKIYSANQNEGAESIKRGIGYQLVGTSNSVEYDVKDLYSGSRYTFVATACNDFNESEYSDIVSDSTMLRKPTNLVLSNATNNSVIIKWDYDYLKYIVYRSTDNINFIDVGRFSMEDVADTIFEDNTVSAGVKYYYRIEGFSIYDKNQKSEMSDTLAVSTLTELKIKQATTSLIEFFWDTTAEKYKILRSTDGTNFAEIATISEKIYKDSTVEKSKVYYYKVVFVDNNKDGATTSILQVKAIELEAPEGLIASKATPSKVCLNWESVDKADKYVVYRSQDKNSFAIAGESTTPLFEDTAVQGNSRYYYKVKAVSGTIESEFSEIFEIATPSQGEFVIPGNIKIITPEEMKNNLKSFGEYGIEFYANKKLKKIKVGDIITGMIPVENRAYYGGEAFYRKVTRVYYESSTGVISIETQNATMDALLEGNYTSKQQYDFNPSDVRITINPEYTTSRTLTKVSRGGGPEINLELLHVKFSDESGKSVGELSGKMVFRPGIGFERNNDVTKLTISGGLRFEGTAEYSFVEDKSKFYETKQLYKKVDINRKVHIGDYTYGTWVAPFVYAYVKVPLDLVITGSVAGSLKYYFTTSNYDMDVGATLSKNGIDFFGNVKENKVNTSKDSKFTMYLNGYAKLALETGVFVGLYCFDLADVCASAYIRGQFYLPDYNFSDKYFVRDGTISEVALYSGFKIDLGLNRDINKFFSDAINFPTLRKTIYEVPEKILMSEKSRGVEATFNKKGQIEWKRIKLINTTKDGDYCDYAGQYAIIKAKYTGEKDKLYGNYTFVGSVNDSDAQDTLTYDVRTLDSGLYSYKVVAMIKDGITFIPGPESNAIQLKKVELEDKNFETALREKLNRPDGDMATIEMIALIQGSTDKLDFSNRGIKSLKGIENLAFFDMNDSLSTRLLAGINLSHNEIEDTEWMGIGLDGKERKYSIFNLASYDNGISTDLSYNKIKKVKLYSREDVNGLREEYGFQLPNYSDGWAYDLNLSHNEIDSFEIDDSIRGKLRRVGLNLDNNQISEFVLNNVNTVGVMISNNKINKLELSNIDGTKSEFLSYFICNDNLNMGRVSITNTILDRVELNNNGITAENLTLVNDTFTSVLTLHDNNLKSGAVLSQIKAESVGLCNNGLASVFSSEIENLPNIKNISIAERNFSPTFTMELVNANTPDVHMEYTHTNEGMYINKNKEKLHYHDYTNGNYTVFPFYPVPNTVYFTINDGNGTITNASRTFKLDSYYWEGSTLMDYGTTVFK